MHPYLLVTELEERLKNIRTIIDKENNTICISCTREDQWKVVENVRNIFYNYPIIMGEFDDSYSFVEIIEKLPSTDVKNLLPACTARIKNCKSQNVWIDSNGTLRRIYETS